VFHREWESDVFAGEDGRKFVVIAHAERPSRQCLRRLPCAVYRLRRQRGGSDSVARSPPWHNPQRQASDLRLDLRVLRDAAGAADPATQWT
jgi:hypothetical protein